DHAAEILQLERAAEIVQVVHGEGRVFRGELDVVVVAGGADQLHQRRPGGENVRADRRLAGVEQLTETIVAHDGLAPPGGTVVARGNRPPDQGPAQWARR